MTGGPTVERTPIPASMLSLLMRGDPLVFLFKHNIFT